MDLEAERIEFAGTAINLAISSQDNADLLDKISQQYGSDFLVQLGEGTTRRVYSCPSLGVVLKLQRESGFRDPLSPRDMAQRLGEMSWLGWIGRLILTADVTPVRRLANLCEVGLGLSYPLLLPRMYGFLGSFGRTQDHPSIIVAEAVRTLDTLLPDDCTGVSKFDIALDETGKLHIFDPRLTAEKRPDSLIPFETLASNPDLTGVWLGNIGIASDGRYVFCDGAGFSKPRSGELLNESTFTPKAWGETERGTPEETLKFSYDIFTEYQTHYRRAIHNGAKPS